ncbi:hypothetical protein BaRGS_00039740 [Batillaria attramentaria]|uniref:Uncharacterized protein n=1 Tax=Batillaria attramentaria TaxID=370345 RepID=A0ABD0J204_9CAEN
MNLVYGVACSTNQLLTVTELVNMSTVEFWNNCLRCQVCVAVLEQRQATLRTPDTPVFIPGQFNTFLLSFLPTGRGFPFIGCSSIRDANDNEQARLLPLPLNRPRSLHERKQMTERISYWSKGKYLSAGAIGRVFPSYLFAVNNKREGFGFRHDVWAFPEVVRGKHSIRFRPWKKGHGLDDDRLSKLLFSLGSLPLTSEAELSQNAQQLTCFILTALTVIAEIMKKTVIKHPTSAEPQASSSEGGDHSSMKKVEHKEEPAFCQSPDQISMETGSHDIPVHSAIVQGLSAFSSGLSEDSVIQQIHQREMTTTKLESVSERGRPKKLLSSFNCGVQMSKMRPGIADSAEVDTLSKTTEKVVASRHKRRHPRKASVCSAELIESNLGAGGGTTTSERKTTRKRGRPRKSPASFSCDILSRETIAIIWDNSVSMSHRASECKQLENGPSFELGTSIETDVMFSVSETGHEDDQHKRCSDMQLGETEPGVENKGNVTVLSERELKRKRVQPKKYGPHRKTGRPPKLEPQDSSGEGGDHISMKTEEHVKEEPALSPDQISMETGSHDIPVHFAIVQGLSASSSHLSEDSFVQQTQIHQRDMTTTKLESVLSERGRPKKLLSSFNCDVQASKMGPGIVDNTEVNTLSKTTEKVIGSRRKRGHPRKSSVYSTELIETSLGVGGGTTTSERKNHTQERQAQKVTCLLWL